MTIIPPPLWTIHTAMENVSVSYQRKYGDFLIRCRGQRWRMNQRQRSAFSYDPKTTVHLTLCKIKAMKTSPNIDMVVA